MNTVELITKHFEEQRKPILAMAKRQVGEFWHEDCVSEAYTRCLQYAGNKKPILEMDYYIKYVLGTVIREYLRDNVSGEELEEWMWESGELADEMRASGVLGEVLQEMEKLDEPHRSAVYLSMISGERVEKTSKITGMSEGAIKMAVMRFRREVREKYGEGEGL